MMDGHEAGMPVVCWVLNRHYGRDSDVLHGHRIWGFTRLADTDQEEEADGHTYVDWVDEYYDAVLWPDCIDKSDKYLIARESAVPDRVWVMRAKLALGGAA